MWNGRYFAKDETGCDVRFVVMHQLMRVYARLREELTPELEETMDVEQAKQLQKQLKELRTYNTFGQISGTMPLLQSALHYELLDQLDANPDILNVKNGVLRLDTGGLDAHSLHYMCSKMADIEYMVRTQTF
jgi:phage/plasmid-associated DNA primase